MPKNPLLFPDKFTLDGTAAGSGIGALEIAVANLSIASKAGAMRQANAIRGSGLISIKNQNRGMPTLNSLLPTRSVGKFTVTPSEPTGTLGYFLGGTGDASLSTISSAKSRVERFSFATNTIISLGDPLVVDSVAFAISNTSYGYPSRMHSFWRIAFLSELLTRISAMLFPARCSGASLKSQSRGYMCAGTDGGTTYGNVDRFSFTGEVCVSIGALFQARADSCGFGNKFNGYLAGGLSNNINGEETSNIERFAYASESRTQISALLARGKSRMSTWMPGSTANAYLMSGESYAAFPTPNVSPVRIYYSNTIEKFVFNGESCSLLGSTLPDGTIYFGATGNATRVVIAGGKIHTDAYSSQSTINIESTQVKAFTFATEVNEILGAALTQGRCTLIGLDNASI